MRPECEGIHVFHVLAQLLSAAIREFCAVGLLLVLSLRADGYDFFNQGLILFLILIVVRLPFINAYSFVFEASTIHSWDIKHVGVPRHDRYGYTFIHGIVILTAHICAGIAAAGFRIYYEVAFGMESMGPQPKIEPQLTVDTRMLEQMGTEWMADERLARLGSLNGVKTFYLPLNSTLGNGIDKMALSAWYCGEEAVYVCLLCICFVHIWIGTGVVKEKEDMNSKIPLSPFRPQYWQKLFRISAMLTMIQLALSRAFPTAHGSLHVTAFKIQYQMWHPNAKELDTEHSEAALRILGGLLGVVFAKIYSRTLLYTKEHPDETFYFSLIWGMESPFAKEKRGGNAGGYYQNGTSSSAPTSVEEAAIFAQESYGRKFESQMDDVSIRKTNDVRLRLPCTLNHSK
jgi:hypothetical protein